MHVLSNDHASQDLLKQGFQKKKQKLYKEPYKFQKYLENKIVVNKINHGQERWSASSPL
jgi:hypothetical protein